MPPNLVNFGLEMAEKGWRVFAHLLNFRIGRHCQPYRMDVAFIVLCLYLYCLDYVCSVFHFDFALFIIIIIIIIRFVKRQNVKRLPWRYFVHS